MIEKELEEYYRDMFELFRNKGWLTLLQDLQDNADNINSVEHATSLEDLYFRKGQLNILGTLLNLESTTTDGYEALQEDDHEL